MSARLSYDIAAEARRLLRLLLVRLGACPPIQVERSGEGGAAGCCRGYGSALLSRQITSRILEGPTGWWGLAEPWKGIGWRRQRGGDAGH